MLPIVALNLWAASEFRPKDGSMKLPRTEMQTSNSIVNEAATEQEFADSLTLQIEFLLAILNLLNHNSNSTPLLKSQLVPNLKLSSLIQRGAKLHVTPKS